MGSRLCLRSGEEASQSSLAGKMESGPKKGRYKHQSRAWSVLKGARIFFFFLSPKHNRKAIEGFQQGSNLTQFLIWSHPRGSSFLIRDTVPLFLWKEGSLFSPDVITCGYQMAPGSERRKGWNRRATQTRMPVRPLDTGLPPPTPAGSTPDFVHPLRCLGSGRAGRRSSLTVSVPRISTWDGRLVTGSRISVLC